jgi:hypothetical protein
MDRKRTSRPPSRARPPACPTPKVAAPELGYVPRIYLGDESVIGWRPGSAGPRPTTKEVLS